MSRLVVVSNRVAMPQARGAQGGLAVAVIAALRETGGLWFGWDGKISDDESIQVSLHEEGHVDYATLPLTREAYENYYKGFANSVLWPLCHFRVDAIEYHREYFTAYEELNTLFVRELWPLLRPRDVIWVHDYHCIPIARELRRAGSRHPIGFFLHIPFPPYDLFRTLPDHQRLLRDFCNYDLIGFQTHQDYRNFADSVRRGLGAKLARGVITFGPHKVRAGAFPIGIDVDNIAENAQLGLASQEIEQMRTSLRDRKLITGVDRLDYSKGLVERFRAFERMLERYPAYRGNVVYMQIAQPSRSDVPEYQEIRHTLEGVAGRVNGRFSEFDWTPLHYLNKGFDRQTTMGFLALSHIGLVTPLRDGMNLVAKEFIAAQDPEDPGVLVLSEFTGAARELQEAIIVNPYDADSVADAITSALSMPLEERKERLQGALHKIRRNDVTNWRRRFVSALRVTSAMRAA